MLQLYMSVIKIVIISNISVTTALNTYNIDLTVVFTFPVMLPSLCTQTGPCPLVSRSQTLSSFLMKEERVWLCKTTCPRVWQLFTLLACSCKLLHCGILFQDVYSDCSCCIYLTVHVETSKIYLVICYVVATEPVSEAPPTEA